MAVRADAEWAAGDEAAAPGAAAASSSAPPPGFESAARQEHLSEAAALRGRTLGDGADAEVEVRFWASQLHQPTLHLICSLDALSQPNATWPMTWSVFAPQPQPP